VKDENGNGSRFNGTAVRSFFVGVPIALFLGVAGIAYKSIDDRIEARRQEVIEVTRMIRAEVIRIESRLLDQQAEIAASRAERQAMMKELVEMREEIREIRLEQMKRTPFIYPTPKHG
jgi:hypothetical protein